MTLILDISENGTSHDGLAATPVAISVTVASRFDEVEAVWRRLERDGIASAYQRFDWQQLFHGHLGDGATPCLAILSDAAGQPQALLPLAIHRHRGLSVASFIGGKHANFGMGLWSPRFARQMTPGSLRAALRDIAAKAPYRIDLFRLTNQPLSWSGLANPLALLPHRPSASFGYHLALADDAEAVLGRVVSSASRRKLKKKEKALAGHGAVTFRIATTRDEVVRFADTFLAYKATRFRALGIPNAFEAPGVRDFIIEAGLRGLGSGHPTVELCALMVGDVPVALFGGTVASGRYSGMFNAMTSGPLMRESPGELLLHHLIRHCCARGLSVFDLGAGEARYKSNLCDGVDELFDQFIPVTWRGRAASLGLGVAARAKRHIKQSAILWPLVVKMRRARGRTEA